ncbi:unnamed protein product [Arabidopsis lyrata]|uniref:Uncharacterized protein n=1 Tax=Arabidopsis lyrata subsp. lyrata TaxID=81972 RepID=D7KSC2_ARALL|nr:hypothetical protein ARALYDRAFT_894125 [Arabidopsis lyrata subsp. lyrata]CAH8257027.1 unnamed protein product [Arabidopsis lyrata]
MAVIRMKICSPTATRDVMFTSAKVTADVGVEMGIIDSAYDSAAGTVEVAVKLGEEIIRRGGDEHVYGKMGETLCNTRPAT